MSTKIDFLWALQKLKKLIQLQIKKNFSINEVEKITSDTDNILEVNEKSLVELDTKTISDWFIYHFSSSKVWKWYAKIITLKIKNLMKIIM